MLLTPLVKIVGSHNTKEIGAAVLSEDFNEYVYQTKLLIIGEMHTRISEQRSVENKLKIMLAGTASDSLRVNMKSLKPIQIPNLLSVVFMSNHQDALTITGNNAARYLCWWCGVERQEDDYYVQFGEWLSNKDNIQAVYYYLKNRDLSKFNPKANAVINEFTQAIIEDSKDSIEIEITYRIADSNIPFHNNLVSTDDICMGLSLDVIRYRSKISKVMKRLGYHPKKVVAKIDGAFLKRTLYVVRGKELYDRLNDSDLLRQYRKQQKH
jgi:hypothetical protein